MIQELRMIFHSKDWIDFLIFLMGITQVGVRF